MVASRNYYMVFSLMQTLKQDVLYALRTLAKSPAYAAVTILTLALGIGANTAIFSVVNGVMLKPLPYPRPDRLEFITSTFPELGFDRFWVSLPEWAEFKERNRSFQDVGALPRGSVNLGTPERPRRVNSGDRHAGAADRARRGAAARPAVQRRRRAAGRRRRRHHLLRDLAERLRRRRNRARPGRRRSTASPTRIVGIMPPGYDIHDERHRGLSCR